MIPKFNYLLKAIEKNVSGGISYTVVKGVFFRFLQKVGCVM